MELSGVWSGGGGDLEKCMDGDLTCPYSLTELEVSTYTSHQDGAAEVGRIIGKLRRPRDIPGPFLLGKGQNSLYIMGYVVSLAAKRLVIS